MIDEKLPYEAISKYEEKAECGQLRPLLAQLGKSLDQYLQFEHGDAMERADDWKAVLGGELPQQGVGAEQVISDMSQHLIPNGSQIPNPGSTAYITTGATSIGVLATLSGSVAAPQRIGLTAFNFLERQSLDWMKTLFSLPQSMEGIYSSGGSVANLVGLGAARQSAFEKIGIDASKEGIQKRCRIYASSTSHRTIHRGCAVLGLGRDSVACIPVDDAGRMCMKALKAQIAEDLKSDRVLVALVGNAGTTDSGAIDPIAEMADIAEEHKLWLHIDGAYGLPGILDPDKKPFYKGLERADSITVDPHKWLGAPVGIGATFVKNFNVLERSFTQEAANYLEGSVNPSDAQASHSMDSLGIPYTDLGVELSAPSRGAVVWALIREIGVEGLTQRVCRHNAMAKRLAERVSNESRLELCLEPMLSVVCFRYIGSGKNLNGQSLSGQSLSDQELNDLNKTIHRQMVRKGKNMPSTTMVKNKLVIRPCFLGARTTWHHADDLFEEVLALGDQLLSA